MLARRSIVLSVLALISACASRPHPALPPEAASLQPWGAMDLERWGPHDAALERSLIEALHPDHATHFDHDADGRPLYPILALSGGGSRGAYGAGVLAGWSASGSRPTFKIVTGISTGALMATFAFLGPDYDDDLREFYTRIRTRDILFKRSLLAGALGDALADTAPLERLLERTITDDLLDAVARAHLEGRRLYVGSTNLDNHTLAVWDLGAIAASGRPDRGRQYRRALLASASIPVFFPPVYFDVEHAGRTYSQMHVDGGAQAAVFFRGFMLDFVDAARRAAHSSEHRSLDAELYLIVNGQVHDEPRQAPVPPNLFGISLASVAALYEVGELATIYRIYARCSFHSIGFNLAAIPSHATLSLPSTDFDPQGMAELFDLGFQAAASGSPWLRHPPGVDARDLAPDHLPGVEPNPTTPE